MSIFPMRFLCAEDDELSAELLERVLTDAVTEFKVTQTLRDTMVEAEARQHQPEDKRWTVILLDLRLLDSRAEDTIEAIHTLKRLANAPVVVVTGMSMVTPNLKEKCLAAGADRFVEKSVAHSVTSNALRIAVIAATLHHPGPKSRDLMEKVRILEGLVNAA